MKLDVPIEVRYAETDGMGVVYHANYLIWFEYARSKFLQAIDNPYEEIEAQGYMSPVLTVEVNYGTPFKYGDTAIVRVWVSKAGLVKTEYSYEVYLEGEDYENVKPHITGKTSHCLVDEKTFKPLSQKKVTPKLYEAYKQVVEEE